MVNMDKRTILWVDCTGGLAVGVIVLACCNFLSNLDSLPIWVTIFVGFANLGYGSFSLWLTTRSPRPLRLVRVLAIANIAWLAVCITIVMSHWQGISTFGVFHKLGEGLYVALLGCLELKWRHALAS